MCKYERFTLNLKDENSEPAISQTLRLWKSYHVCTVPIIVIKILIKLNVVGNDCQKNDKK